MPCLLTYQNFANIFWEGSPKEHFYEIISKSDQWFQRRKNLKHFSEVHTVQKKPPPWRPCFSTNQNFANNFWKRSHKEQSWTNSDQEQDFLRISSCPYSAKFPYSPEPCSFTDQTFTNNFSKGSPKENSCEIISKSDQRSQENFFFQEFLHVHIVQESPIHQSHVYGRFRISWTIFWKGHPRNIPVKSF